MEKPGFILILFILYFQSLHSQYADMELGIPLVRNYLPEESHSSPQNWQILQHTNGLLYVGNTGGLLEYDGQVWNKIEPVHYPAVYSLAEDASGTIFVGSSSELGYLSADNSDELGFVSLHDQLEEKHRNHGPVWKTLATPAGIFFITRKYLLRYAAHAPSSTRFKVWEAETAFLFAFYVHEKLFVPQQNYGLMELVGDSLKTIPGGGRFETNLYDMISLQTPDKFAPKATNREILLLTRKDGLFRFNGQRFDDFPTDIDAVLKARLPTCAVVLPGGDIAIGTYDSGVLVIDANGKLNRVLDQNDALGGNSIHSLHIDRNEGLWISTNYGISRVEITSPLSYFEKSGLRGHCQSIVRHKDSLYVATDVGVFVLHASRLGVENGNILHTPAEFMQLQLPTDQYWDMLSVGASLIIAANSGIINRENEQSANIYDGSSYVLHRSRNDSNRVYVGTKTGMRSLYHGSGWVDEGVEVDIGQRVRWIAEDAEGRVWLSSPSAQSIYRISWPGNQQTFEPPSMEGYEIEQFDDSYGLEKLKNRIIAVVEDKMLFSGRAGLLRYDERTQHFVPDSTLGHLLPEQAQVTRLREDPAGTVWVLLRVGGSELAGNFRLEDNNSYVLEINSSVRLPRRGFTHNLFPDRDGVLWFGSKELIRYDPIRDLPRSANLQAMVRRVIAGSDSVVFGGALPAADQDNARNIPILKYARNALRFEYALPSFDDEAANRFQYLLEGFDNDWSAWTLESRKDYTNLPEGNYRFRVRAKDVYEQLSREGIFSFSILAPWYRSWWAYGLYASILGLLMLGLVKWRSRKLELEKQILEEIIAERTRQVQAQSEKLKEMAKVKSRFFANISHEFRTPLTLIIGPLREMTTNSFRGNLDSQYASMLRNAQRLLRLINQLLDLSRLESGGMELNTSRTHIVPFVKTIVQSFESLAQQKHIELRFICDEILPGQNIPDLKKPVLETTNYNKIYMYIDRDRIEKMIYNLLSNAFKFTDANGRISVEIKLAKSSSPEPLSPSNTDRHSLTIVVTDSGIGIAKDQLPYVFDRFYQVDSSQTRQHDGSGVGLALTKELVQLHGGTISVNSGDGKGAQFIIQLPVVIDQSSEDEIIEMDALDADSAPSLARSSMVLATLGEGIETHDPAENANDDHQLILVVEDNPDVRQYIREQLKAGYRVIEAEDGLEGVNRARKAIPDLIVSDVMMPNLDGYELCHELKTNIRTSHIPIILLTARAEDRDKIEGLETGADDYLVKPFNSKELLVRIRNLIESRRIIQEKFRRDFLLQPKEVVVISVEEEFLKRACDAVEAHLGDPEFSVAGLADVLAMDRSGIYRKIRALTSQSTSQFIRSVRLRRAAQLLKQRGGTITEIAFAVGFSSSAYFAKCFQEQFGCSPRDYAP